MYHFNQYDGRLQRSLETALLVNFFSIYIIYVCKKIFCQMMNSLEGMGDKFMYDIVGHSGDSPSISFSSVESPPKNEQEKLKILLNMSAHSQFCWSGDNTVSALRRAMKDVVAKEAGKLFFFLKISTSS
jgi:von Willebrand factor A domain-containing protein 8